jgi:hypothetical protein
LRAAYRTFCKADAVIEFDRKYKSNRLGTPNTPTYEKVMAVKARVDGLSTDLAQFLKNCSDGARRIDEARANGRENEASVEISLLKKIATTFTAATDNVERQLSEAIDLVRRDKGISQADATNLLNDLNILRDTFRSNAAYLDIRSFAREVEASPMAAVTYFQSLPTSSVPAAFGSNSLLSPPLAARSRPVSGIEPRNPARPSNAANAIPMADLRAKAQKLGIKNTSARDASGIESVFSDIVEFRKQTRRHLLTPHTAEGVTAKTAALAVHKRISPEGRNFEQTFRTFGLPLPTPSHVDAFVVLTERDKYSAAQWAVSTARSKAANMALRPSEFLTGCGTVSDSVENDGKRAKDLKSMATAFIMESNATAHAISEAIKTPGVPSDVKNELQKLQTDCLNNQLYKDMIAFAGQIEKSPDLGLAYFDSLRRSHAV